MATSGLERDQRTAKSYGIDLYIFLKWTIVLTLWVSSSSSVTSAIVTSYLLWSNIFTYFYYHVWETRSYSSPDWQRRRFVSLIQSIAFNVYGFSYLYRFFFQDDFTWKFAESLTYFRESILSFAFSALSLFGSGSSVAEPTTLTGLIVMSVQTVSTFIFLTLILSNTQINKEIQVNEN